MASQGTSAALKQKGTNDNVKVYVRVRPFNEREINSFCSSNPTQCTLEALSDTIIGTTHPSSGQRAQFPFDRVFWSIPEDQVPGSTVQFAHQEEVFSHMAQPTLDSAFEGYNGCIFAYGQTSSGKTYTMQGTPEAWGVIPRLCNALFTRIAAEERGSSAITHTTGNVRKVLHQVELSYLEIYQEKLRDLLEKRGRGAAEGPLELFQDPKRGPVVKGVRIAPVATWPEVERLLDAGFRSRTTASTAMNATSSRSHALLQLTLTQTESLGRVGEREILKTRRSRINLVDLAGSEKIKKSEVQGQNLKEATTINQSLTTLGRVIDRLVNRDGHIPYRDSMLTSLLSDSLGGNSRTTMLAALSPAALNFEETLSTLRYASRTRMIVNVVKVNEDAAAALIRDLQDEVARLTQSMGLGAHAGPTAAVVEGLRLQLRQTEGLIQALHHREQQERAELQRRTAAWEADRAELEAAHRGEVRGLEARAEELRHRQDALLATQQMLESRLVRGQERDARERARLLADIAQAKDQRREAVAQQDEALRQLMAARFTAASNRALLDKVLETAARPADDGMGDELLGDGAQACDMCQRRAARFRCPECDGERFCPACDAAQHRAPPKGAHRRYPLGVLPGEVPCDMCGERAMEVYCRDCPGAQCEACDKMIHKNPKRAHHVRVRGGENAPGGALPGNGERSAEAPARHPRFPTGTARPAPRVAAAPRRGVPGGSEEGERRLSFPSPSYMAGAGARSSGLGALGRSRSLGTGLVAAGDPARYKGGLAADGHRHGVVGRQRVRTETGEITSLPRQPMPHPSPRPTTPSRPIAYHTTALRKVGDGHRQHP